MRIHLEKFGSTLTSRPTGKDAYAGFSSVLDTVPADEIVEVDCGGVSSLSPSWGDEFFTPLLERFGNRLVVINTKNPSVAATIELLEEISGHKFNVH